jgi:hypothetical protein
VLDAHLCFGGGSESRGMVRRRGLGSGEGVVICEAAGHRFGVTYGGCKFEDWDQLTQCDKH